MLLNLLAPLLLAPLSLAAPPAGPPAPGGGFRPLIVSRDLSVEPESERRLRRLVIGLDANQTKYFMLPEAGELPLGEWDPRVRHLRRQLYWFNFELSHGRIMSAAPPHTLFFVAVPEPGSVPGSLGNEEESFRDYLARRVGWSASQIAERVRFFRIPGTIEYPQDMAEVLGLDARERLVLGLGSDTNPFYFEPLRRLTKAFPSDFVLREIPGVDTEGGDVELAWLPDGRIGLLLGRHRVLAFLEKRYHRPFHGRRISAREIREATDAFSRAFFGIEVLVVGEAALHDPNRASSVLMHSDMVVNVVRGSEGLRAFVPSYGRVAIDAITRSTLEPGLVRKFQWEYDAVARQLRDRGYKVVRLPFADHPARNPVQVGKFIDPVTGRQAILLGKYPYHRELPDGRNPQWQIQEAIDELERRVGAWRASPSEANWASVEKVLRAVWSRLDEAAGAPNPDFAAQARIYEKNGIRVLPVPIYPSGEGGIHCLLLK